ncbi:MAG: phosphoglycolate phosphatase [Rhodospirillaceae bacterium]|nr:MAG: phosphoglycolate phosphatase [Rhodospirillaceae bacterium]
MHPPSVPRAVVFDLDGTLIDSAPDVAFALNAMLAERDLPPVPAEQVRTMIGEGVGVLMEKALAASGLATRDAATLAHCAARYKHFYASAPVGHTIVYDGVPEVLAALQAEGYRLGLCTNKPHTITHLILEALGLAPCFTAVVGGESLPFRKPDARPLLTVLMRMGVERTACVYVGDSEIDVETARNARVPMVLMRYGYARTPVEALAADVKLDSFRDVPKALAMIQAPDT